MKKPKKKSKRSAIKKKKRRMRKHALEHTKEMAVLNSYKHFKLWARPRLNPWRINNDI